MTFNYLLAQTDGTPTAPAEGQVPALTSAPADGGAPQAAPQTTTQQDGSNPPASDTQGKPQGINWTNMIPLALMFVVIYFLMFRGPRKRQQEQQKMLDAIQKGTKVRTIGGIIGTVVDVRDDEVVLKIDEATNAKIRMVRSAISKVYTEAEKGN